MIDRIQYWLIRHPRITRQLKVLAAVEFLACMAVGTAPNAMASTNAAILIWTGLHDSYGVPAGDLYLSLASLRDQVTQTGPDASMWDPSSWWPWMAHGMAVMFDNLTAANILTGEISLAVGIFTLSMWIFRLTISSYWLTVLGELARSVTAAVIGVTTRAGLVATTVPLGVYLGVLAIRRGERGRGATLIMVALFMPSLALTIFSDPAGMMYGPNGLLQFGRRMAFSTAQAATYGGAISGGGFNGQVDTLTSSMVTHVIREPLEVFNFGHVVDHVGQCGPLLSAAYKQGAKDGPIKALAQCGDSAAVHYAQNLDGTNVFGGFVMLAAVTLFGWFMVSSGNSVFRVSVKAIYTTVKLLPSLFAGGVDGAAYAHAKSTVWKYFKHPIEVGVFITFVSVIGLSVERLISQPLPAELGGTNPFAHVLMMGASSMVALSLLRHIRADLEGTHPGRGMVSRAGDVALYLGMRAALGGAGRAALGGVHGLRHALGAGKTPWEKMDEKAASSDPQEILGNPQEGFHPVSSSDDASPSEIAPSGGAEPIEGHSAPALNSPNSTGQGLLPGMGMNPAGQRSSKQPQGRPRPASRSQRAALADPALNLGMTAREMSSAQEVAPISGGRHSESWEQEPPPASSYVDHNAEVPLPLEAPPDDDISTHQPPPDLGPSAASVEPITGH
jgi:hypothetical protein